MIYENTLPKNLVIRFGRQVIHSMKKMKNKTVLGHE